MSSADDKRARFREAGRRTFRGLSGPRWWRELGGYEVSNMSEEFIRKNQIPLRTGLMLKAQVKRLEADLAEARTAIGDFLAAFDDGCRIQRDEQPHEVIEALRAVLAKHKEAGNGEQ